MQTLREYAALLAMTVILRLLCQAVVSVSIGIPGNYRLESGHCNQSSSTKHTPMPDLLTSLEIDLHWLAAVAGISTLVYAIIRIYLAWSQPASAYTGAARKLLRTPFLVIATIAFVVFGYLLWKPLPITLPHTFSLVISVISTLIFLSSLGLYLWGMHALRGSFNASSGFGVRLQQGHQLVTNAPFAYVRHPMYVGVILACWSGLVLYRTWTMLIFSVIMLGLIVRAQREEQALKQTYGRQWELYHRNVPAWFPRLKRRSAVYREKRSRKST